MNNEKKNAIALDDDALDKVCGGTSLQPVPPMMTSTLDPNAETGSSIEIINGRGLSQIVIGNHIMPRNDGSVNPLPPEIVVCSRNHN